MFDESTSDKAKPEESEMESDDSRQSKGEVTPEEWQASIDSMTPEERQLFERIQSEISIRGELTSFTNVEPKEGQPPDPYYEVPVEDMTPEDFQEFLKENGYSEEDYNYLNQQESNDLLEARKTAIDSIILNNSILSHPSMTPAILPVFHDCRLPHEGVRRIIQIQEQIKSQQEKNVLAVRILNNLLNLNRGIVAKGDDRKIGQEKEEEIQQSTFDELRERYSKYFHDGEANSELPEGSQYLVKSGDFPDNYNKWFVQAERAGYEHRFREWFKGEKVIDLGCGARAYDMAEIVLKLGAKEYIGVDKNFSSWPVNQRGKNENIGCIAIKDDILAFLRNEPDNSATLVINGMDEFVFDTQRSETRYYIERLAKEISRVAGDHRVVGVESFPIFKELENHGYRRKTVYRPTDFVSMEELTRKDSKTNENKLLEAIINHQLIIEPPR
ncbi:MAG: hypothetical protein Q7S37_00885 [bacterium]|nr:hypothetical protein [bacterium]